MTPIDRKAAAYIRNGTWDEAFAFFGLDESFMWDNQRIVEQCLAYRKCLAREASGAKELAAYRALARRSPDMLIVRELLAELCDYAESSTLEDDPLPPCVDQARALLGD